MNRNFIIDRIRKIVQESRPKYKAFLYGSEARGDAKPDSDIDILILVEGDRLTVEDEMRITEPLYDIELESGVCISPLVMLRKAWENRPFKTPFYLNVKRDGIEL